MDTMEKYYNTMSGHEETTRNFKKGKLKMMLLSLQATVTFAFGKHWRQIRSGKVHSILYWNQDLNLENKEWIWKKLQ